MTGHMRKRGENSWQPMVFLGFDETGRRRYATKTVKGTRREAQSALAAFVTDVVTGDYTPERERRPRQSTMTVEEVVRAWLEAKTPRLDTPSGKPDASFYAPAAVPSICDNLFQ